MEKSQKSDEDMFNDGEDGAEAEEQQYDINKTLIEQK